jgi:hypothetical protein
MALGDAIWRSLAGNLDNYSPNGGMSHANRLSHRKCIAMWLMQATSGRTCGRWKVIKLEIDIAYLCLQEIAVLYFL